MRRGIAGFVLFVGLSLALSGGPAFVYAMRCGVGDTIFAHGFGPHDIVLPDGGFAFVGGAMLGVGCGLFVLGLTWVLALDGSWRPLLCSLLLVLVPLGAFVGWTCWTNGRLPSLDLLTDSDRDRASDVAADYLASPKRSLATSDQRQRFDAQDERQEYIGMATWTSEPIAPDEVQVTGTVLTKEKSVFRKTPQGASKTTVTFAEPRLVHFTIRVKKQDGTWLVDDFEYKE